MESEYRQLSILKLADRVKHGYFDKEDSTWVQLLAVEHLGGVYAFESVTFPILSFD